LIDKSLLLRAEAAFAARPLYRMLETVRAYATLGLVAAGERDEALEGLAHHCHSEAGLAGKGLVGSDQVAWLHRVRDDLENYRSALGWFIEHGGSAQASDIAFQLMFFWLIRGHAAEGLRWYEQILNLRPLTPAAESRALAGAAVMWYTKGELDPARTAIDRALALAQHVGDLHVVALANLMQGHLEHLAGNLRAACERFTDSIENFEAVASPWGAGNALSGMAWVALAADDGKEAERLLDRASQSLREAGPWFLALGLYVRASLAVRKGKADEAIALMAESLTSIRELQDKFAFVHALVPLASAAVLKGNHVWAARILGARDAVAERTGATVADNRAHELLATAEREARARLGPDRWARTYAAGQSASIDSLLKEIERARS
jgi:tetratricopeptide (TPR) repeat protein